MRGSQFTTKKASPACRLPPKVFHYETANCSVRLELSLARVHVHVRALTAALATALFTTRRVATLQCALPQCRSLLVASAFVLQRHVSVLLRLRRVRPPRLRSQVSACVASSRASAPATTPVLQGRDVRKSCRLLARVSIRANLHLSGEWSHPRAHVHVFGPSC